MIGPIIAASHLYVLGNVGARLQIAAALRQVGIAAYTQRDQAEDAASRLRKGPMIAMTFAELVAEAGQQHLAIYVIHHVQVLYIEFVDLSGLVYRA